MEMLSSVEVAVHSPHDPVEHVAGAMPPGVAVRDREPGTLTAEIQDRLQDHPGQYAWSPLPEPTQALSEPATVGRMVRLPDPSRDVREHVLEVLGPVADLQPRVQEAQQDYHLGEQGLPGGLCPLPAIGADGLGGVLGGHVAGFVLEDLVGDLQLIAPRRSRRFGPQAATTTDRRGDIDLLPVESLVMFIRHEVLGQSRPADGGPHDAGAAEAALQAIPEPGIVAEDTGQGPERDAELAEEQRALDIISTCRQVGHQERRPDAIGGAIPQGDASDQDLLLGREAVVLESVSVGEVRWEQLGHPLETGIESPSELSGFIDDPRIGGFRDGQANGTMPT